MHRHILTGFLWASTVTGAALAGRQATRDSCPGYSASGVAQTSTGFTAELKLAGSACNIYGRDIQYLKLTVNYDTCTSTSKGGFFFGLY
jgi:alpha-glucosidase